MTIIEVLKSPEAVLPESIRMLFPSLTQEEFEKVEALNTLFHSHAPFEDYNIFEKVVLALNGQKADFRVMQGATPEQIFYAFYVIGKLGFDYYFDWEVKQWIKVTLELAGVYFYPEELKLEEEFPLVKLSDIKAKAEFGPFPLGDDSLVEIQASRWLAIQMYIDKMIAKEVW